jgi:signal transduction histidine kinase
MSANMAIQTEARILIVDDEEAGASGLARLVERAGYAICITITDPVLAVNRFLELAPDVVLLDLHMEPISGVEVLEKVRALLEPHKRPPVLVLTADTTAEAKCQALAAGAMDFLSKPLDYEEVLLRIRNVLQTRQLFQKCQQYSFSLEQLVQERTEQLQRRTQELEATLQDLRATQRQVIQQERIRALGAMASGIAHDMNNSLTLVLGYGDMLLKDNEKFPPESKERLSLDHLVRAARDNAHMVERLREFYRPRSKNEDRQPVDMNELLAQVVAFTTPKWQAQAEAGGASIQVEHDRSPVPVIAGAPAELREVLTNLIFNAVDAMPQGGTLRFRTRQVDGFVRLEVSDTGTGMTEETLCRCLEPFYTTKGERGTGLGLAVSYGIVRRHGGRINVESRLNQGTTFQVDLPISTEEIVMACREGGKVGRPLHVLVVDDQEGIREIVSAYLSEDGHVIETAADAMEAMRKYQSARFDLVITDRAMPGINGDELATAIKRMNPRQPVIMLTGFADWMDEVGLTNQSVDLVIGKPARLQDLRQAILDVMPELAVA